MPLACEASALPYELHPLVDDIQMLFKYTLIKEWSIDLFRLHCFMKNKKKIKNEKEEG